jgi:hypothetical protein
MFGSEQTIRGMKEGIYVDVYLDDDDGFSKFEVDKHYRD